MANAPLNPQAPSTDHKYQALLAVSEAIVSHRDLSALFHELAGRHHQVAPFDYLARNTPPADKSQPGLKLFAVPLPITSDRRACRGTRTASFGSGRSITPSTAVIRLTEVSKRSICLPAPRSHPPWKNIRYHGRLKRGVT